MNDGDFRPGLNAIRAFASIWVVIYHFRYYSDYPWFDVFGVKNGYLGVDIFFVLSGLIISHVYLTKAVGRYGFSNHVHFLWLRIARLWPVHALIMIAMLVVGFLNGNVVSWDSLIDWVTLTLMVRQWFLPSGYVWNTPAWSISAEFFAYTLLFPIIIGCVRKFGFRCAASILTIFAFAMYALLGSAFGTINAIANMGPIIRVAAGFSLGAGLFCHLIDKQPALQWSQFAWGGFCLFALSLMSGIDILSVVSFCIIMVSLYLATGRTAQLFSAKPFYYLGEWSFALDLIRFPLFSLASFWASEAEITRGPAFCFGVLALSIGCAALTYRIVEIPARKWLRNISKPISNYNLESRVKTS